MDEAMDWDAEEFLQISFSDMWRSAPSTCHSWWTHAHGHPEISAAFSIFILHSDENHLSLIISSLSDHRTRCIPDTFMFHLLTLPTENDSRKIHIGRPLGTWTRDSKSLKDAPTDNRIMIF